MKTPEPVKLTLKERAAHNRRSWLCRAPIISGIQMRDVTAGTLELCRELKITFIDDFSSLSSLSESDAQRQIFTFLFIHGHPEIDVVLQAVFLPPEEFRREYLIPFAMPIRIEEVMPAVLQWMVELNTGTLAALVEIIAKPSRAGAKPDAPPPNSSSPPGCQE